MAKLSLINREAKRAKLVAKFAAKRVAIKLVIANQSCTEAERYSARLDLQKLPRNSSPVRQRKRCLLTGRPRGVFRKFGLARAKVREIGMRGEIPGLIKASW